MSIILETIKILREKSGAGMVDCKKALEEAGGDIDKSIEILRKKGIAKAAKREDREASEGLILTKVDDQGRQGYILQVNSETDFVARNQKFIDFAEQVMDILIKNKPVGLEEFLNQPLDKGTVQNALDLLSGTIGEKLSIKKFDRLSSKGTVAAYAHMGGRIGVLAALDKADENELAYEIAMQVAAANPKYVKPEDIPADILEKEKEIYTEQLLKEGKPENIIGKIIIGKINKFYEEVCLTEQEYIKEEKKKISALLGEVKVEKFIRYSL